MGTAVGQSGSALSRVALFLAVIACLLGITWADGAWAHGGHHISHPALIAVDDAGAREAPAPQFFDRAEAPLGGSHSGGAHGQSCCASVGSCCCAPAGEAAVLPTIGARTPSPTRRDDVALGSSPSLDTRPPISRTH
ncbi:MAG: hypothetical protein AB7P02_27000 [Alphaproteobacteria bacterium]